MKQGSNTRGRPRGRVGGGSGGKRTPNRNQTFDSNGPSVRLRGNAMQLVEKYTALARDTSSQGDRVLSENYLQHADHYYRVYMALTGQIESNRPGATLHHRAPGQPGGGPDDEADVPATDSGATETAGNGNSNVARRGNGRGRPGNGADRSDEGRAAYGEDGRADEQPSSTPTATATATETGDDEASTDEGERDAAPRRRAPRRTSRGGGRTTREARDTDADTGDSAGADQSGDGGSGSEEEGTARPARRTRRGSRRSSTSGEGEGESGDGNSDAQIA